MSEKDSNGTVDRIVAWIKSTEQPIEAKAKPVTGWDYTQDERDWAVEMTGCDFCEARRQDPCIVMNPYKHDAGAPYDAYAHLPRLLAVFG